MKPLTNLEIFDLAAELARRIKGHLDESWYDKSGITLSINWSDAPKLGAWASVAPTQEAPTRHEITLTYKLVESIYSEAMDFAMFALGRSSQIHPAGMYMIPAQFELLQAAEFMFESGITFVIFHEIGHINQLHGPIRAKYGPAGMTPCTISEFTEVDGSQPLAGDLASIYHATEFAADFEALDWMATSLEMMFKGDDFNDHAYLQVAIVSCIMLIFNGDNPVRLDPTPVGSHPYPVPRMDFWTKTYAERTQIFSDHLQIKLNKEETTKRLMDASFLALMKWMTRHQLPDAPQYTDFCKGTIAHPNHDSYMREVINLWSLEYQQARNSRKYGRPLSVLYFSDEFRIKVGATKNHETLKDHLRLCLAAIQHNSQKIESRYN